MGAWARLGRWLPVLFVTGLIAWCYLVFMLDILIPLLDSPDKAQHEYGTGCTIAFNIIFALAMISFLRAVFTDPGYIPDSWSVHPDDLESGERTRLMPAVLQTQEKKHDGTVRICRKSKPPMYKPDRAHYCRVMQRCVLKMDHFCPWLNNCIGFYNHKFFVLFVAYMALITVFMVVVMTPVFVNIVSNMEQITLDLKDQEFHVSLTYLMLCLLSAGLSAYYRLHRPSTQTQHVGERVTILRLFLNDDNFFLVWGGRSKVGRGIGLSRDFKIVSRLPKCSGIHVFVMSRRGCEHPIKQLAGQLVEHLIHQLVGL